ncbi:hypothetical protein BU23DRAFT_590533 [Bimuria novae-zelandiae CBS 107.79]|uniref:Uncharacterized protein n=1 Tax=Bimuria novae-zelandiae CBS 107.79 TaxID=1447943 RepID=A0A6A5V6F4_9PLEO|nr:hypothetical protein BU23DRAFT_590533 [Bimuria novae-zelandiae CBS 107.79]
MGITVSHATTAPLFLVSTIIGLVSFAFTVGTFLKVFWQSILTLKSAPREICDYLSNLKQALLEERRHLRKVKKRMKRGRGDDPGDWGGGGGRSRSRRGERRRSVGGNGHGGGGKSPRSNFGRDEQAFRSQGESELLRVMRIAIRDMIWSFRQLNLDSAHWSTNTPAGEKSLNYLERWLWLHRKDDVITMSEGLARIEVRRTAHEVGAVAMMFESIRQMEGRLNRVVGVRRVD